MAEIFLKQYEVLFIKAQEDLVASKYLLDGFNNHNLVLNLEIVCFQFQQCAEKLIKSLLDFNQVKFPHSHDIEDLIKLTILNKIKTISEVSQLIPLTEYAVEGRYSIIHDDLDDADKYVELLDELLEFTKESI